MIGRKLLTDKFQVQCARLRHRDFLFLKIPGPENQRLQKFSKQPEKQQGQNDRLQDKDSDQADDMLAGVGCLGLKLR